MRVYRLFIHNLIFIGILFCSGLLTGAEKVRLDFEHFYDCDELEATLKALEKAYPNLMTLQSVGRSHQRRDIWAVILNNPKTGAADHKPGFYIDGNIHGNEIQGGEVALYTVWYLLSHYGETKLATRLLDERAFYIIPTMNPDSRDYYIHQAADPSSPRTGLVPLDEDRDGVADEDVPKCARKILVEITVCIPKIPAL